MRKESINTFNDGLNYDLNPLATPNSVLVDNINGTFLTFNGDELVLQNDAGNTKIVEDKKEYQDIPNFVRLKSGFHPLGVKEYGGVLYIVSGKDFDRNLKELKVDTWYTPEELILSGNTYYKCIKGHILSNLTDITNTNFWTVLGTASTNIGYLRNDYNEIEFGSYPGPSDAEFANFPGNSKVITSLYMPFLLNNHEFKSGRYLQFTDSEDLTEDISTNNNARFLEAKLYLQLDQGSVDLTEDIWERFREHNPSGTHWLLDESFKYYCKGNLKGKLMLQFEIKDINFKVGAPQITENDNGTVDVSIPGNKYFVKYTKIKDSAEPEETKTSTEGTVTFNRDNSSWHYKIVPNGEYNQHTIVGDDFHNYPIEFVQKYTFTGTIDLYEKKYMVGFNKLVEECAESNSEVKVLELINDYGPISNNWKEADEENKSFILIKEGFNYINQDKHIQIGTFTEMNSEEVTVANININYDLTAFEKSLITDLGKVTTINYRNSWCNTLEVPFKFSVPLAMRSPELLSDGHLFLYQEKDISSVPYKSSDLGRNFVAKVNNEENLIIQLSSSYFGRSSIVLKPAELLRYSIDSEQNKIVIPHVMGLSISFRGTVWSRSTGRYLTFRTIPIPIEYESIMRYISEKCLASVSSTYLVTQEWKVSNGGRLTFVTEEDFVYLELEINMPEGTTFPQPETRSHTYYVDIKHSDFMNQTLTHKDAANFEDPTLYTMFKEQSKEEALFIRKLTSLYVYPESSPRITTTYSDPRWGTSTRTTTTDNDPRR